MKFQRPMRAAALLLALTLTLSPAAGAISVEQAREILRELESDAGPQPPPAAAQVGDQVSLLDMGAAEIARRLRLTDVNTLTPIEAMNLLFELKQSL